MRDAVGVDDDVAVPAARGIVDRFAAPAPAPVGRVEHAGRAAEGAVLVGDVGRTVGVDGDGRVSADVPERVKYVVELALSDRQLLRNIEYVRVLDDEGNRFKKAPASFQESTLGNDVKDALQLARDIAVRNAGQLAKDRYQRNLDELNEHLRDSAKILIDITAAQRNQLDQAIAGGQVTAAESKANIVKPDEEHVIWPFNGEYWRDELGFYRQTITSKCGR